MITEQPFLTAMYRCNLLYGVSFTNSEDFEEIALIAWETIGNKHVTLYKFIGEPDENGNIQLPCNCDYLEAVVAPHEDWNYTSNKSNYGDLRSEWIEEWIEMFKFERNPLYASGHYVHYTMSDGVIHLEEPAPFVLVIYKGIILDDDDLPTLNEKEISAIATFVAWVQMQKLAFLTMNGGLLLMALQLERRWYVQCDLARTPAVPLTQNDFDNIANAKSRWPGGKRFGKSFKPLMK